MQLQMNNTIQIDKTDQTTKYLKKMSFVRLVDLVNLDDLIGLVILLFGQFGRLVVRFRTHLLISARPLAVERD